MESNLIKVPFYLEMAKRIINGEVKGRVVTREGNNVRILCWDKKDKTYHIAALVDDGDEENFKTYTNEGVWNTDKTCSIIKYDLMLEIPEYMTFKDGDVVMCGWSGKQANCKWISLIKDVTVSSHGILTHNYATLIVESNNVADGELK